MNKRDVKDGSDDDLTQEPEMIRAFRDTWELGIHSYLTYRRDRLLLAKERLARNLRAEIDTERIEAYRGTVSLPFEAGLHKRVAVKIVDDRGIESLRIIRLK